MTSSADDKRWAILPPPSKQTSSKDGSVVFRREEGTLLREGAKLSVSAEAPVSTDGRRAPVRRSAPSSGLSAPSSGLSAAGRSSSGLSAAGRSLTGPRLRSGDEQSDAPVSAVSVIEPADPAAAVFEPADSEKLTEIPPASGFDSASRFDTADFVETIPAPRIPPEED